MVLGHHIHKVHKCLLPWLPNSTQLLGTWPNYCQKTRSHQRRHTPHCFMHSIIVEHMSCLVHGLHDSAVTLSWENLLACSSLFSFSAAIQGTIVNPERFGLKIEQLATK